MLLNVILVVVGLIICFGGIYLRRVCSALMGFVWGVLAAFVVALMTVGIWGIGDDSTTIAIFIAGIVFAVLSAIYYKACAAINGFLSSATIVMLLLLASDGIDSETVAFIIAIVIGIICATISVKFYDYSFIITTALSGGLVASIGGFGIIHLSRWRPSSSPQFLRRIGEYRGRPQTERETGLNMEERYEEALSKNKRGKDRVLLQDGVNLLRLHPA